MSSFLDGRLHAGALPQDGDAPLQLNREEALGYLGYQGQSIDEGFATRFEELAESCERTAQPSYAWAAFPLEGQDGSGLRLGGGAPLLQGESIREHLAGAVGAVLMACTLGLGVDREVKALGASSAFDSMLFDACGSALAESCANALEALIVAEAANAGLHTNWRFSPGYGDLPLDVQPAFIKCLGAPSRLKLNCSDSFLLVPAKSITAVIGLFEGTDANSGPHGARKDCASCTIARSCLLRSKGLSCHERKSANYE